MYYKRSWMKALVAFVFLLQTHSIYIQKSSWFWYLLKNVLIQSESIGFGKSYRLWLDQSNSKILETPVTEEKSKLFNFFWHIDTNQEELQIKVGFSSLCQGMLKDFRHRDAFWLIIFNIIAFIIIVVVCYLTLAKIHINDKTNLKSNFTTWFIYI